MKESPRAAQAWADYLAMGPGRSLEALVNRYRSVKASGEKPPTTRLPTLADWSRIFGWQDRLREIAEEEARKAADREAAYRREILEQGYGLVYERVSALKRMAGVLFEELTEGGRLWVREPKQLGSGESATIVELERFNHHEVEQFRGLLDDIAKEKGERKAVSVLSGDKDNPLVVEHTGDDAAAQLLCDLIARGLANPAASSGGT